MPRKDINLHYVAIVKTGEFTSCSLDEDQWPQYICIVSRMLQITSFMTYFKTLLCFCKKKYILGPPS